MRCSLDKAFPIAPRCTLPLPTLQAVLQAGVGYAFVVDGVNGASGQFAIRCVRHARLVQCRPHLNNALTRGYATYLSTFAHLPTSAVRARCEAEWSPRPTSPHASCPPAPLPPACSITAEAGAVVKGSQPPASLQSASIEVASVGPAAHTVDAAASGGFSMAEVAGATDRFWLLAPWGACTATCMQVGGRVGLGWCGGNADRGRGGAMLRPAMSSHLQALVWPAGDPGLRHLQHPPSMCLPSHLAFPPSPIGRRPAR